MFTLQITEKRRIYNGEEPREEWVVTHDITVPNEKTLAVVMHAIASEITGKR